jgi:hypothetical protein
VSIRFILLFHFYYRDLTTLPLFVRLVRRFLVCNALLGPLIDLWELDDARRSDHIAPTLEHNFYARCPPEKRPRYIREQDVFTPGKEKGKELDLSAPNGDDMEDVEAQRPLTKEEEKRRKKMYDESLVFALEKTFRYNFWMGGILQLIGGESPISLFMCLGC